MARVFRAAPGMRVRAARDIGSGLAIAVRRGTVGTVVQVRHGIVLVQFDGGRCLGVPRQWLERLPEFDDGCGKVRH